LSKLKEMGMLIAGWSFLVLGVIGLFLPILQGVLFIMVGLALLSSRSQTIRRLATYLERRYPEHHRKVETLKKRIARWLGFGGGSVDQGAPPSA